MGRSFPSRRKRRPVAWSWTRALRMPLEGPGGLGRGERPAAEGCRWASRRGRMDVGVILKRFDTPDEVREMPRGRFEVVRVGGLTIGRATYQPGGKWSDHVGPLVGARRCSVEHVGLVVSG